MSSSFDVSTVSFSKLNKSKKGNKSVYISGPGGSKLYIQTPYMRTPFGLSAYTDDKSKTTSYSLDLALNDADQDPAIDVFWKKIEALDDLVLKTVVKNSKEWLGKERDEKGLREFDLFKPMARPGKDQYADKKTFKLKVLTDLKTNAFIPECYNHNRQIVPLDSIEKNQKLMCIIEVSSIWIIDGKFGTTVRLTQCILEPSRKLPSFAFQGLPEPEKTTTEEEQEEEEVEYEDEEEEDIDDQASV
jgi:hypothetical protein